MFSRPSPFHSLCLPLSLATAWPVCPSRPSPFSPVSLRLELPDFIHEAQRLQRIEHKTDPPRTLEVYLMRRKCVEMRQSFTNSLRWLFVDRAFRLAHYSTHNTVFKRKQSYHFILLKLYRQHGGDKTITPLQQPYSILT